YFCFSKTIIYYYFNIFKEKNRGYSSVVSCYILILAYFSQFCNSSPATFALAPKAQKWWGTKKAEL
ncbi:MAG: hypothetical protein COX29_01230, partial [Candidatus Moranbacteria bacterium CG23_combo_of_CG06-09_8_20_14_all_35_22]